MAFYGLSKPFIAKLDVQAGTYSDGFQFGHAVGTSVSPQYNEANLYGDNQLQETAKEFKYADVSAETTHMPIQAADVLFGHKVDKEKNKVIYNMGDTANYVGYGFYVNEKVDGVTKCVAAVLPKVLFAEAEESYTTKGENLEFKTPSVSGKAMAIANGDWKIKETFATEEEAVSFIKEYLGITDDAGVSVAKEDTVETTTDDSI